MIEILYKPSFIRQYKKLPEALKAEIKEKIELFKGSQNHSYLKTHKLKGKLGEFYSFSVNYDYRIIFEYESKKKITFLMIGNHDIYK